MTDVTTLDDGVALIAQLRVYAWDENTPGDQYYLQADDLLSGGAGVFQPYGESAGYNEQTGTSYTLVLADKGKLVAMNNAGANTLTVPPNADVAFPVNTRIDIGQLGAGQTTIAPGSGVTIHADPGLKITAQYAGVTLQKIATDTWWAFGALEA